MQLFAQTRTFNDLESLRNLDCYFKVLRRPEQIEQAIILIQSLRELVKTTATFNSRSVTELAINIACQYRHEILADTEHNRRAFEILQQLGYIDD